VPPTSARSTPAWSSPRHDGAAITLGRDAQTVRPDTRLKLKRAWLLRAPSRLAHRVGIVTDPEEEHLAVEIVHTADGTRRAVRRKRERIGGDLGGVSPARRERVGALASPYAGHPRPTG
jgi:hypothetical protein